MKSTKRNRGSIKYGSRDLLSEDAFNPRETKFRVSMYIDLDVLNEARVRARKRGLPYQTFINQFLRDALLGSEEEERIRKIVREEMGKKAS